MSLIYICSIALIGAGIVVFLFIKAKRNRKKSEKNYIYPLW